jgi:hypothetical protein
MNGVLQILRTAYSNGVLVVIGLISLAIVIATLQGIFDFRRRHPSFRPSLREGFGKRLAVTVIVVLIGTPSLNFCLQYVDNFVVTHSSTDTRSQVLLAVCAVVIGCVGFNIKIRKQHLYGALEIMFGLVVAYQSMAESKAFARLQIGNALPYCTAIYVIIRGLTNVFEGFGIVKPKTFLYGVDEIIEKTVLRGGPSPVSSPQAPRSDKFAP